MHQITEKAHSRKPISIHSHAYAVPGRMLATRLFSELPRRTLLGSSVIKPASLRPGT
jgi:hypothetical protein